MSDPLAEYLHDHLAGSSFAVELLTTLRDSYKGEPLETFASELIAEITKDQDLLRRIIERTEKASPDLKEAAAWLAEKVSRLKLRHDHKKGLGTFEALETLALGILGKKSLWQALAVVSQMDARVAGFDYEHLIARAHEQYAKVEACRLQVALQAFLPAA